MSKSFTCPYCNKPTTATAPHVFDEELEISLAEQSVLGRVALIVSAVSCPNPDCRKLSVYSWLAKKTWNGRKGCSEYEKIYDWHLLPESNAKVLPEYVPGAIQNDYKEACRIRDLSPKASATLARRCLQGMIRDFWGISKSKLFDEVAALEEKVDSSTWEAIDSVRSVGNIGAHMERDINLIIDVDPEEAQLLIELIEQLIDDWYVVRDDRQKRLKKIKEVAVIKQKQKDGTV